MSAFEGHRQKIQCDESIARRFNALHIHSLLHGSPLPQLRHRFFMTPIFDRISMLLRKRRLVDIRLEVAEHKSVKVDRSGQTM